MSIGLRIAFVLFSQILLIGFLSYNYVVFYETDKIVLGFIAVLSAVLTTIVTLVKLLPSKTITFVQDYAVFVLRHINSFLIVTAALWLLSIGWTYSMSNDLVGRLVYVNDLQDSMSRGALDLVSLPDPDVLAKAFAQFPDRREVPFLLERSARLLFQAGRTDIFRTFQRSFLERLDLPKIVDRLCKEQKTLIHHDSLSFLLSITAEAYSEIPDSQGIAGSRRTQATLQKYLDLHDRVARCQKPSLEAKFQLIKFEDEINDLEAELGNANRYDIDLALKNFESQLAGRNHQRTLDFWQSHGAQEYLDFLAYKLISQINTATAADVDKTPSRIVDATNLFERLLLVRQRSLRPGEVQWSAPPQKLSLFYAFMLDANLRTLTWPDMIDLFTTNDSVKDAMREFSNRKIFEEFRTPRGWFAGTPLDFSLNGSAAVEKVNSWLKMDW